MSFGPIQPARIDFTAPGAPRAPDFDDLYHSRAGAAGQARHVFLGGNGLPGRWAGAPRFVVLETGFGLGNNFLATWAAWRDDPARCERLVFVSIEKHPPLQADLRRAQAGSPWPDLAAQFVEAWPPLTPDIHVLEFAGGQVRLLLVLADLRDALPELVLQADAIYLDGFAPARNPQMWDRHRLRGLARLCAPGATLATWSVAREVREGLAQGGFIVEKAPGFGGKRDMTVARFAPRWTSAAPPARQPLAPREAIVVGAGLAGAGVARALAAQGVAVEVIEQAAQPGSATSGNAGGLFHGIVHAHDGAHARWLRAAALRAQQGLQPLIRAGALPGGCGLLRGERELPLHAMQALLAAQALPADWVQALPAEQASALAGLPVHGPAWHYPGGGWVAPGLLVQQWLASPGIAVRTGEPVAALQRDGGGWRLLDAAGRVIARSEAIVLANSHDAMRLLRPLCPWGEKPWPWQSLRGQVSLLAGVPQRLPLALADSGYALQLPDGRVLCGATSQADDEEPALREADHRTNLATLQRLTGWAIHGAAISGRVGWRMQTGDRLPLLGPVPLAPAGPALAGQRLDQPRFLPRERGLYIAAGYGSRGITHAALAGELLAATVTGAPVPAPASLVDALDPARFAVRISRRSAS